jgi:hypothetical protein
MIKNPWSLWILSLFLFLGTGMREGIAQSREELVASPQDGGFPYMLVFEDPQGGSKRAPGIYVRGEGGAWIQTFSGRVLPKSVAGGVSAALEMSAYTELYESAVIRNGKLLVFNVDSREGNAGSYLELGSPGYEVLHPVSREPILIPSIEDMRDLSIVTKEVSLDDDRVLELVLVSIKTDKGASGGGITLALSLEMSKNDQEGIAGGFKLVFPPLLLDWEFEDRLTLENRIRENESGVGLLSKLALAPLLRHKTTDNGILKTWRLAHQDYRDGKMTFAGLRQKLKSLSTKQIQLQESTPYIDVTTGDIEIASLPTILFDLMGHESRVVMDPEGRGSGIYVGEVDTRMSAIQSEEPFIRGLPLLGRQMQVVLEKMSHSSDKQLGILRMQDGKILMFALNGDYREEPDFIVLEPTEKDFVRQVPKEFAWSFFSMGNFLVCSWTFEGDQFTSAYRFRFDGPRINLDSEKTISDKVYHPEDLKRRIIRHNHLIVFDDQTPQADSDEQYKQLYRRTGLHIDLLRSLKSKPRDGLAQIFLEPTSEKSLTSTLIYRTYERVKDLEDKTGIYINGGTKEETERSGEPLLRGQILLPAAFMTEVLSSLVIDTQHKEIGEVDVSAVMFDPQHTAGRSAYLNIFFSPRDGRSATTLSPLSSKSILPQNLLSLGLINPVPVKTEKDSQAKKFQNGILISYFTHKDPQTGEGRTTISEVRYERKGEKGLEITGFVDRVVDSVDLTSEEIQTRILFDEQNQAYWVKTPDRDRNDEKFHVLRIVDGKDFRPRVEKSLRLRSLREADSDGIREVIRGRWRVSDSLPYGDKEAHARRDWLRNSPEFQTDVFPSFRDLLDDLANGDRPARHVVLIVPDDLLNYAQNYPWALRYRDSSRPQSWSARNEHHQVFMPREAASEERATQGEFFKNLGIMREDGVRKRSLLISPIEKIRQLERPVVDEEETKPKDAFYLSNTKVSQVSIGWESRQSDASDIRELPHALYLLATEGQRIDLAQFRPGSQTKTASVLLIGTARQWEQLKSSIQLEEAYGLSKHFEVVELGPPNVEMRKKFALENVLYNPVIRSLDYQPNLKGMFSEEDAAQLDRAKAEEKLMDYLVHRSESLAIENRMPVFEQFMKVLNELANQLMTNEQYRLRRILDLRVIEKVLARVFPMALNLKVLPEDDPLRILSREDADFLWQKAGYAGPVNFKERIIKVILAQLSTDEVRSLKSSVIIYGPTGSSKTRAIRTLFQMLGLKMYRFDGDALENDKSWGFELNLGRVMSGRTAKDSNTPGERMITFEEAKKHLDLFLSGENGARGFVFLDDVHLAPDDVKAYFLKKVRSLQDDKTYKTVKGQERPTRNISIFLALNPIDTPERIKKFAKNPQAPTDLELILASLSSGDGSNDVERSALTRFGDIINLGRFPASSKGPALLSVLAPARQTTFGNSQRVVFVNPAVIDRIISNSPHSDARTFLSAASGALMKLPKGSGQIFVLSDRRVQLDTMRSERDEFYASGGDEAKHIEDFINRNFQAISVEEGYSGKLELLRYVLANFRLKVFQLILESLSENRDFMKRPEFRQQLVLPLSLAIHRHLTEVPEPFLGDLILNPDDLGAIGDGQRHLYNQELEKLIGKLRSSQSDLSVSLNIGESPRGNPLAILGMGERTQAVTRQQVLADTVSSLGGVVHSILSSMMQTPEVDALSRADQWLKGRFEDKKLVNEFSKTITEEIEKYYRAIFDARLQAKDAITPYEAMRFLVLAVDRAIARQRWGHVVKFLIDSLRLISRDMSVGQSPQVQSILFKSESSIFTPMDQSLVLGLARSLPLVDHFTDQEIRWDARFRTNCRSLLSLAGGAMP